MEGSTGPPGAERRGPAGVPSAVQVVRALPGAAVLVAPDDTILACSSAGDALLGVSAERATGRRLGDLDQRLARALSRRLNWLASSPSPESDSRHPSADMELDELAITPIRDASNLLIGVLVTAPEPAAAHKNDFLAMLAHELRNPLAAIMNALQILRQRVREDRVALQAVQIADRQVRHQARLLDDLLDASRVVLGKISLHSDHVDLSAVVRRAMEAVEPIFHGRAHQVTIQLPEEPLVIEGDADRLEQVMRNLLGNAAKYTGPGGAVRVSAGLEHATAVIRVSDTGVGIDPAILPRVFDLFVQADSSLARSEGGLGIGLTLVQHLVRLHGGSVVARSGGRGQGSEFEVRLPRGAPAGAPGAAAATAGSPGRAARRVLIVEDNRDARQMLRMLLEIDGHSLEEAATARAGIELAAATAPDVVLIDIGLPDLDGYDVARAIRKRLGARVRLVALTGYGDSEARRKSAEAGFDAHLVKPVAPGDLDRALQGA